MPAAETATAVPKSRGTAASGGVNKDFSTFLSQINLNKHKYERPIQMAASVYSVGNSRQNSVRLSDNSPSPAAMAAANAVSQPPIVQGQSQQLLSALPTPQPSQQQQEQQQFQPAPRAIPSRGPGDSASQYNPLAGPSQPQPQHYANQTITRQPSKNVNAAYFAPTQPVDPLSQSSYGVSQHESTPLPPTVPQHRPAGPLQLTTTIIKGPQGIGLDLTRSPEGHGLVLKLKEFPGGANPAARCNPPMQAGDLIIGVNGMICGNFADIVNLIRSSGDRVSLTFIRK